MVDRTYVPGMFKGKADDANVIQQYLEQELMAISRTFAETQALELRPINGAPDRPRDGMIVYADGIDWNPGGGTGPYCYVNGVWLKISTYSRALTANSNLFVRTDGNDANDGLTNTAGGAFKTIQRGVDVARTYQLNGYDLYVNVAAGTYTAGASLVAPIGGGRILIQGNVTTPSSVVVSVTNAQCFVSTNPGSILWVGGFKCIASGSGGYGVYAETGGQMHVFGKMEYGTASGYHIVAGSEARIWVGADYAITGGALYHYLCVRGAFIQAAGITITGSGAQNFSGAFANADNLSLISVFSTTYSGTGAFTGTRFSSTANSSIFVNGAGVNFFPGNAAGATATGGIYG